MAVLFALTMFVSATLLFLVQPMVGKMVLPLLGGTPAVWNTCMVFFQALLLAGYFYAHRLTTTYDNRRQTRIHLGVLAAAVAALAVGAALSADHSPIPVVKDLSPQGQDYPFFGVIALLGVAIGLPFFTVSTSAPLLQKWFAETGHRSASDPYFLYGASNFGSLLALAAYPVLVEPNLKLVEQAWVWTAGFAVLGLLVWCCARAMLSAPPPRPSRVAAGARVPAAPEAEPPPSLARRLRWLGLAFVPSSLMLSVTTFVSTDIASLPLLWVIPLALYLLTFIIAFSRVPAEFHLVMTLLTPVLILLLVFLDTSGSKPSSFLMLILLHMVTFFAVAMVCHGELARSRPSPKWLTSFYLTMSLGGMLGGMFNSLVAPIAFNFVSEYPITLVAACLLLPRLAPDDGSSRSPRLTDLLPESRQAYVREHLPWLRGIGLYDLILPLAIFWLCRVLVLFQNQVFDFSKWLTHWQDVDLPIGAGTVSTILTYGIPAMLCYFFVERPIRFGLGVAALLLASHVTYLKSSDSVKYLDRSFFGTLKVEEATDHLREVSRETYTRSVPENLYKEGTRNYERVEYTDGDEKFFERATFRRLVHGTTLHGKQRVHAEAWGTMAALTPLGAGNTFGALSALGAGAWESWQFPGRDPLTYYHRTGPVGAMFDAWRSRPRQSDDVACIGLGTGTLSSYGLPGEKMTFFEIDTHVRRLVEPPTFFTYIDSAKRQGVNIEFAMGDARLELERMNGRRFGMMLVDAFSSDAIPVHLLTVEAVRLYFDRLTDDGLLALHISNRYLDLEPVTDRIVKELGLEARVFHDGADDSFKGKTASTWIAVAKSQSALGIIATVHWEPLPPAAGAVASAAVARCRFQPWARLDPKGKDVGLWTDNFSPIMNILQFKWRLW